jgi:NAD-dependent oxidoreductase involved in siderophore biosynthesis
MGIEGWNSAQVHNTKAMHSLYLLIYLDSAEPATALPTMARLSTSLPLTTLLLVSTLL